MIEPMWFVGRTPVDQHAPVRPGSGPLGETTQASLGTLAEIVAERDHLKAEVKRQNEEIVNTNVSFNRIFDELCQTKLERNELKAENERLSLEAMQGAAAPLMATLQSTQDPGIAGLYAVLGNLPELIAALGKEIRAKDQPAEPYTRVNVDGQAKTEPIAGTTEELIASGVIAPAMSSGYTRPPTITIGDTAQRCTCCNRYYDAKIGSVMVRESVTLKAVPNGPNVPQRTFTITLPSGQIITVTE